MSFLEGFMVQWEANVVIILFATGVFLSWLSLVLGSLKRRTVGVLGVPGVLFMVLSIGLGFIVSGAVPGWDRWVVGGLMLLGFVMLVVSSYTHSERFEYVGILGIMNCVLATVFHAILFPCLRELPTTTSLFY